MIVMDDSNSRILKMKEKLLEVNAPNREENLEDYKRIALELDKKAYNDIIEKINDNHDYVKKSLQEQLAFLTELESDYNALNELQHRLQNTYQMYGIEALELSNIDNILIDNIRKRLGNICGYLVGMNNINRNNEELERLSLLLIEEDKKSNLLSERLRIFENKLKENLLKSEGRVYDKDGNSTYTSIVSELNWQLLEILGDNISNDDKLDLKKLVNDSESLKDEITKANKNRNDLDESLQAAKICYENIQSINNKDIYESIRMEYVRANYKITVLSLVDLISTIEVSYDKVVQKREQLNQLLEIRKDCLKELGIKYLYDPFERIGIKEQLEDLNKLGNNDKVIKNIRQQINDINARNESIKANGYELIAEINKDIELVNDDTKFADITEDNGIVNEETEKPLGNQVISVHDKDVHFMIDKAKEKTQGVIKRVNQMMNETIREEITPELVIENNDDYEEETKEISDEEEIKDYVDIWPSTEDITEDTIFENDSNDVFMDDAVEEKKITKLDDIDVDSLFTQEKPFEEVQLFSEKADDVFIDNDNKDKSLVIDLSNDNTGKTNSVIDTIESKANETVQGDDNKADNIISFDQFWTIKDENTLDNTKVKKLVA